MANQGSVFCTPSAFACFVMTCKITRDYFPSSIQRTVILTRMDYVAGESEEVTDIYIYIYIYICIYKC
jgi:hypothetical protein